MCVLVGVRGTDLENLLFLFQCMVPTLELAFPGRMLDVRPDGDGCRISLMA